MKRIDRHTHVSVCDLTLHIKTNFIAIYLTPYRLLQTSIPTPGVLI